MANKLLEAGGLENLDYLQEGCSVLHANGMVGYVDSVMESSTAIDGSVGRARLSITYPCGGGQSYHSYRHDGRSREEAGYDIVRYIESWQSKVKSIKVWSSESLCHKAIKVGNEIGILAKLYIDTEKDKRTKQVKPGERNGFKFTWQFTKKGEISVKVWSEEPQQEGE